MGSAAAVVLCVTTPAGRELLETAPLSAPAWGCASRSRWYRQACSSCCGGDGDGDDARPLLAGNPQLVLRPPPDGNAPSQRDDVGMIVVGIDGSEGSARALWFAADEARVRKCPLRIVTSWQIPVPVYAGGLIAPTVPAADVERTTRDTVAAEAANVMEQHPDVESEIVIRQGSPAAILVEESKGADMLVVGSRGLGGFGGLLLGSVSQQCAHHAVCPVLIVPPADRA